MIDEKLFPPDPKKKPTDMVIIRNGMEISYDDHLLLVGDKIKTFDREYIICEGGVWRRYDRVK